MGEVNKITFYNIFRNIVIRRNIFSLIKSTIPSNTKSYGFSTITLSDALIWRYHRLMIDRYNLGEYTKNHFKLISYRSMLNCPLITTQILDSILENIHDGNGVFINLIDIFSSNVVLRKDISLLIHLHNSLKSKGLNVKFASNITLEESIKSNNIEFYQYVRKNLCIFLYGASNISTLIRLSCDPFDPYPKIAGNNPLYMRPKDTLILESLLKECKDNAVHNIDNDYGQRCLGGIDYMVLAKYGCLDIIKSIISMARHLVQVKQPPFLKPRRCEWGRYIDYYSDRYKLSSLTLDYACRFGQIEFVKYLHEGELKIPFTELTLDHAADSLNFEMVKYVLNAQRESYQGLSLYSTLHYINGYWFPYSKNSSSEEYTKFKSDMTELAKSLNYFTPVRQADSHPYKSSIEFCDIFQFNSSMPIFTFDSLPKSDIIIDNV